MSDDSILPFTGERFTPECVREIAYEHWHRYAFALGLVKGKRVLDAACGEGFGASLLANHAEHVLAVDIDSSSIEHAKHRYANQKNLSFLQADVTALDSLPTAGFDVIISYETLEHVQAHERLLAGFVRLLKPDGVLLISTPDKKNYTDATGVVNPHHLRELYAEDFKQLIDQHFEFKKIYTQKLLFQSILHCADAKNHFETYVDNAGHVQQGLNYPPMYYVAVCAKSKEALAHLPNLSLYGDAEESIYAHYNQEVRYGIWARERIAQLEAQLNESSAK